MNEHWIWFSELKSIPAESKHKLLSYFKAPEDIFCADSRDAVPGLVSGSVFSKLAEQRSLESAKRIADQSEALGIKLMVYSDPLFPIQPTTVGDYFFVLYYKGSPVFSQTAAVVGSRSITADGWHGTQSVCKELVSKSICINSGMAFGIDRCAHDYALHHGGITQGFAAHGLDQCYPSAHYTLMDQISENGAIISPFPVGTQPYKANFLKRNALLALCSDEVIVIEAGEKSGALNTAAGAIRYGKPLWVMKGHPISKHCGGNRKLLAEGAKIYLAKDVLGLCFGGKNSEGQLDNSDPSTFELEIIELLKQCPRTTEQLIEICGMDRLALQSSLLTLEKSRYVAFRPTGFWHYEGW